MTRVNQVSFMLQEPGYGQPFFFEKIYKNSIHSRF